MGLVRVEEDTMSQSFQCRYLSSCGDNSSFDNNTCSRIYLLNSHTFLDMKSRVCWGIFHKLTSIRQSSDCLLFLFGNYVSIDLCRGNVLMVKCFLRYPQVVYLQSFSRKCVPESVDSSAFDVHSIFLQNLLDLF